MKNINALKIGYLVGLAFTVLLGIGSLVFYRERMLFIDPGYVTFDIINNGWFVISEHRYGAWVTQMFPLIGSKVGLSLKAILLLYSMSFYLFFIAVIYVSGTLLKQYTYALLFCLYLVLIVSDVYFWPNNEIHQAVAWMTLFISLWAWTVSRPRMTPLWMHGLMIGSLFFATISHILVIIPLCFLWIYANINFVKLYKTLDNKTLIYSVLIIAGIVLRYWLSNDSWYDGHRLDKVQSISIDAIIQAVKNPHGISFLKLLLTRYWPLLIVTALGFYQLISTRQFLKLGFVTLSALGFYLLVNLTHKEVITATNLFYYESQWMVLAVILSTPFVMDFLPTVKAKFALLMVGLIFVFQVPKLYQAQQKFSHRLDILGSLTANATQQSITKGYVLESDLNHDALLLSWGLPIETLLLSQIDDRFNSVTIKNVKSIQDVTGAIDSVHTAFRLVDHQALNKQYFMLDATEYRQVK